MSYQTALARGDKLVKEINKHPDETSPSPWKVFADLEANGWKMTSFYDQMDLTSKGLATLIKEYDIDTTACNNHNLRWEHLISTYDGEIPKYHQVFHFDAGTIFVHDVLGPAGVEDGVYPIPALNHWSDVTFLQWANIAARPADLKRVVVFDIIHEDTVRVFDKVLKRRRGDVLEFVDRKILKEQDGDDFKALLGTPNALGTAWMLAQHKSDQQLGWKCVESISVYTSDVDKSAYGTDIMVLELGKHPQAGQLSLCATGLDAGSQGEHVGSGAPGLDAD